MLNKVLETCQFVADNAKHVKINYDKTNKLIDDLLRFNNVHYLTQVPYAIYDMSTKDIVNFLLIYDAIDYLYMTLSISLSGVILNGQLILARKN